MANYNKTKFYWLQLKEDFFDEDAIQWLEEQENGKEYSLFYLKLCLKSLRNNGILIRQVGNLLVPYNNAKLAEMTHTKLDTVVVAMTLLTKIGLIEVLENGELYLTQVENMVGSQSKSAFKKQQQRISSNNNPQSKNKEEIEGGGQMSTLCPPKCPPKIEIELEKELDIDKELDNNIVACEATKYVDRKKEQGNLIPFPKDQEVQDPQISEILNYWNSKGIITHKPSETLEKAIKKALKSNSIEDIKLYIDRYAIVLNDPMYYFNYKWSLEKFLKQSNCMNDFKDDGAKWVNYKNRDCYSKYQKNKSQSGILGLNLNGVQVKIEESEDDIF